MDFLVDQRTRYVPFAVPPFRRLRLEPLPSWKIGPQRSCLRQSRLKGVLRTHPFGVPFIKPCAIPRNNGAVLTHKMVKDVVERALHALTRWEPCRARDELRCRTHKGVDASTYPHVRCGREGERLLRLTHAIL